MLSGRLMQIGRTVRAHLGWAEGAAVWRAIVSEESGVTAIEYALIASLVSVLIVSAVLTMGQTVSGTFSTVATSL